jgi:hypothetical protein
MKLNTTIICLVQDIKKNIKCFILYTIGIILLSVISRIGTSYFGLIRGTDHLRSIIVTLFSYCLISIQYFIYFSFFCAYAKSYNINSEYTKFAKAYFHTIKVFILQNLVVVGVVVLLVLIEIVIKVEMIYYGMSAILIIIGIFAVLWNIRLLFIPEVIIFKHSKYVMRDTVKESIQILKENIKEVTVIILIQAVTIIIPVLMIIKNKHTTMITSTISILSIIVNYCATLMYTKMCIEYGKQKYGTNSQLTTVST